MRQSGVIPEPVSGLKFYRVGNPFLIILMNTQKFILLDPVTRASKDEYGYPLSIPSVKVRLITGFTGDNVKNAVNAKEDWNPLGNGKDRLYFLPGCNVPRFKVREYFSCTIKPEYATAAFISLDQLKGNGTSLLQYSNLYKCTKVEANNIMQNIKDQRPKELFFNLINNNEITGVFLTKEFWYDKPFLGSYFQNYCLSNYLDENRWNHKHKQKEPEFQLYATPPGSLFDQLQCDIYLEEGILKHLNKNNLVLSEEKYQELRAFGETEDEENIVLIMELMSNCDFEKSVIYLLFLLKEFGKPISELKESNHVNFKSLLSFLKLKQSDIADINIVDMTRILRDHGKFTRINAMRVSSLFANDYINYSDNGNICWTQGPVLKIDCETLLNEEEE